MTKLSIVAVINLFCPVIIFIYAYLSIGEKLSFMQGVGAGTNLDLGLFHLFS